MESLKALNVRNIDIDIIIIMDKWRNLSKARNIDAKISNGEILVFMDDDVAFNQDFFINTLKEVDNKKVL
jgi:glycosyltransferase involved in cell wall biosynthesis